MKTLKSNTKNIGAILGAGLLSLMLVCAGLTTFADTTTATDAAEPETALYLEDTAVYSAKKDQTLITVPIRIDGTIDMQCYDFTISYDSSLLVVQEDATGITAYDGYQEIETANDGLIHIAGVTISNDAKTASGQVGQITFLLKKSVSNRGVQSSVEISVKELGFDTDASSLKTAPATISISKAAAPEPTSSPAPGETSPVPSAVPTQSPTPVIPTESGAPGNTYLYGDVLLDGKLNAGDALAVLRHIVKLQELSNPIALQLADVNHDTHITASDALSILQMVVELIPTQSVSLQTLTSITT